jgi:hypothetical protein
MKQFSVKAIVIFLTFCFSTDSPFLQQLSLKIKMLSNPMEIIHVRIRKKGAQNSKNLRFFNRKKGGVMIVTALNYICCIVINQRLNQRL